MNDCFGWADFWKINLEKTGLYEAKEIIINAKYLQQQWAKENNINFSKDNWALDILEAQIVEFKPDIFFSADFRLMTPEFRKMIRKKYSFIKLFIGWDGIKRNDVTFFGGCDIIMSLNQEIVDFYR